MPTGLHLPFLHDDGWAEHTKAVKRCQGAACYGALVAHFGTQSPKELEWRIDRRKPYGGEGDPSISNKYRRWRQGKALPGQDTVTRIRERSGGSVRLDFWLGLPLWELLALAPPPLQRIHQLLEASPSAIRKSLFRYSSFDGKRYYHTMLEDAQLLAIRNQHSLAAFITLLCLARKSEMFADGQHHYLPAACAFDILPRILYLYRPLRYQWEGLFACLKRIFWMCMYSDRLDCKFSIETVRSGLQALDADPAAELPQLSGKRVRVIDEGPTEYEEWLEEKGQPDYGKDCDQYV